MFRIFPSHIFPPYLVRALGFASSPVSRPYTSSPAHLGDVHEKMCTEIRDVVISSHCGICTQVMDHKMCGQRYAAQERTGQRCVGNGDAKDDVWKDGVPSSVLFKGFKNNSAGENIRIPTSSGTR